MTNYENQSWYVHKHKIRTDYPVIENLKQFLAPLPPILPKYHPDYIKYWSKETKKCIEGIWRQEFGKWRYMPGNLYFFGSFTVLEHTKEIDGVKVTKHFKPLIVDYLWEYAAQSWSAYGFSGFEEDDETTCNRNVDLYNQGKFLKSNLPEQCFNKAGEVKKYENAFDYLVRLHDKPLGRSLFQNEAMDVIVMGTRAGSKALQHGTKIPTPIGEVAIEDLNVGDYVFGKNGKPIKVTGVFPQGKKDIYEITFHSGRKVRCCKDHLWDVKSWCNLKTYTISTEELIKNFRKPSKKTFWKYKYKIPTNSSVEYSTKDLPIDPYLLGLLIGDGHISYRNGRRMVKLSSHKKDVDTYIDNIKLPQDVHYTIQDNKNTNVKVIHFGHDLKNGVSKSLNGSHWYSIFEKLGLSNKYSYEKFIPNIYKYGDYNQRLRLLQGIMDTDGYVIERGGFNYSINFCSSSEKLTKDVQWLCRSLGMQCGKIVFRPNKHRGGYYITINSDNPDIFKLKRKRSLVLPKNTPKRKEKINWDTIENIEIIDFDYATCISVDAEDHLFLANDFVVTHNSYWVGNGELEYNYVFGGARRYDQDFIDGKYSSRQLVGSSDTTKSSELYDKFLKSQEAKVNHKNSEFVKWFGIYVETYVDNAGQTIEKVVPCPFYKRSLGNLNCPNKSNPYRAKYKMQVNGEWVEYGAGSELVHVNYSSKKSDGALSGVGGRYIFSDLEEVGLCENAIDVKGANDSATRRSGIKFGVQYFQGTSGSIEHVQEAKKLFLGPDDYGILSYQNIFSTQGANNRIGYFLPNYIIHFDCKDENGNTDYDKVIDKINRKRIEKANSKDPKVLRDFIMNEPVYVPEMWITDKGYLLPYEEASERERELMKHQLYKDIGKNVELVWNSDGTVKHKILHNATPINQWPLPKNTKDISGNVVIYEFPEEGPNDLYLICHDPYVEENLDGGGSLGVTYVLKNPKYISNGRSGNIIVASYIGKPAKGLEYYYEQQEKLIAFYGNPQQGLWYEKNRGEVCREYYIRKGKQYLLCLTPQYMQGSSIYQQTIRSFGFVVGNKNSKLNLIKITHDWLLESTEFMEYGELVKKLNIFRIPDKFLIDQIMQYNLDENFDGVSAFMGGILGLREIYAREEQEVLNKPEVDIFLKLKSNNKIFRNAQNIKG